MKTNAYFIALALTGLLLNGCTNLHSVITTTQTGVGVSVSENPSTGLYEARLGYFRNEFAFVPGNTNHPGTVPDVLLEIRMENMLKGGLVYQRLAVGKNAVMQPGAALLFSKNADGSIDPKTAASILQQTPVPDAQVTSEKLPLAQAYQKSSNKASWDAVAKTLGYSSFVAFLADSTLTSADITKMNTALKTAGLP
jgi:hypothetical protein